MTDFGVDAMKETFIRKWPNTAEIYLVGDKAPQVGTLVQNSALANFFEILIHAENNTSGHREAGIEAVRNEFYNGEIAAEIVRHSDERDGLLTREDLSQYKTYMEHPVWVDFHSARCL